MQSQACFFLGLNGAGNISTKLYCYVVALGKWEGEVCIAAV